MSVTKLQKQILSSERFGSSSVIILENSTTMGHGPSPSICNTTVRQTLISLLSIFAVRICQESTAISSFSLAGEDSASSRFLPCANTARQQRQRVCKILWGSSTTGSRRNPHLGHISEATVGSLQLARRMIRLLTEFVLRRNPNLSYTNMLVGLVRVEWRLEKVWSCLDCHVGRLSRASVQVLFCSIFFLEHARVAISTTLQVLASDGSSSAAMMIPQQSLAPTRASRSDRKYCFLGGLPKTKYKKYQVKT